MSAWSRFRNLWRGAALDREFDDELRAHIEMRADANVARGMTRAEAETEARRHLGRASRAREGMRDARVTRWLDAAMRDLRGGTRLFRRQPGMVALAVLTLSLGIGANAVIASLLYRALIRPLPFPDAGQLVAVNLRLENGGPGTGTPTVPEALDLRAASDSFEGLSFFDMRDVQINGGTEPARAFAARIETSFFAVLKVQPALGRAFVAEDSAGVAMLSHAFWTRTFGADPSVIGQQIIVNGASTTVVGVLPSDFSFTYFSIEPFDVYVPYPMTPAYTSRAGEFANVRRVITIGRLKTARSQEAVEEELRAFSRALADQHPELYRVGSDGRDLGLVMSPDPLQEVVTDRTRIVLFLLSGAVALVLLIACVNMAQFLLARALERQDEAAVRKALGASRGRLVSQFLCEALLLGLAAAILAIIQADWLNRVILAMLTRTNQASQNVSGGLDLPAVAAIAAMAVGVTVLFGLLPALHFSRASHVTQTGSRSIGGARTNGRYLLVAIEVGLSVFLLAAAGFLVQNLRTLQNAPAGYSATDVITMRMRFSPARGSAGPTGVTYAQYLEQISAVPGVRSAAIADGPLSGAAGLSFSIQGGADDAATLARQQTSYRIVSQDYFVTLSIPLLAGRTFTSQDRVGQPPVVIINEALAQGYFPGESPIGRQIRAGDGPRSALMTIVGVVGNVRPLNRFDVNPQIYVSYLQQSEPNAVVLVRTTPNTPAPIEAIKQAIWSVAPEQPVFDIQTLPALLARAFVEPRTIAQLLSAFALFALVMSTMGVFTVVTYLTSRRSKEVALRRAVGATPFNVLSLLATPALRWTIVGLVLGIAGAIVASSSLQSVVFLRDARLDVPTMAVIAGVYLLAVVLAVYVPAARVLRQDPARVLRAI